MEANPPAQQRVSEHLRKWREGSGDKTVGGLIEIVENKSFALLFVVLLGVPALPLPTGGVTHVFEILSMLLALQLIVGRDEIWLPKRWRGVVLDGPRQQKFLDGLIRTAERFERFSKPRMTFMFERRLSDVVFGLAVLGLSMAAFLAPPFTGLDTLPALGAVVISLGVIMEDYAFVIAGTAIGVAGVALELTIGDAVVRGVKKLI